VAAAIAMLTQGHKTNQSVADTVKVERCIRLSAIAVQRGDFPFAAFNLRAFGGSSSQRFDGQALKAAPQSPFGPIAFTQLLTVIGQHLLADFSEFFTVILQAG
jgi:hypothetical protein